jgi:hypothetical protein
VPAAVSEGELRNHLDLSQTTGKVTFLVLLPMGLVHNRNIQGRIPLHDIRPIEIFMCSVVMRQGYNEGRTAAYFFCLLAEYSQFAGFTWISQYVSSQALRSCLSHDLIAAFRSKASRILLSLNCFHRIFCPLLEGNADVVGT